MAVLQGGPGGAGAPITKSLAPSTAPPQLKQFLGYKQGCRGGGTRGERCWLLNWFEEIIKYRVYGGFWGWNFQRGVGMEGCDAVMKVVKSNGVGTELKVKHREWNNVRGGGFGEKKFLCESTGDFSSGNCQGGAGRGVVISSRRKVKRGWERSGIIWNRASVPPGETVPPPPWPTLKEKSRTATEVHLRNPCYDIYFP